MISVKDKQSLTADPLVPSPLHNDTPSDETTNKPASPKITPLLKNDLYTVTKDGSDRLLVPQMEYTPLRLDPSEARLLLLNPANEAVEHVRCTLTTYPLTELPPFVAIKNARGHREYRQPIEVDGKALFLSFALERFLRYFRTTVDRPTYVWVRYACVVESDQQEQKAYWTRDFSDFMYTRAYEVFDMHETNDHLVESGYFRRVVSRSRFAQHKQWYGVPDQLVVPRVCPIRLGTSASLDEPTMDFQYMPLDMVADEIRIMCIMPAQDAHAPILIHVAHCPIDTNEHYTALSYCWGVDDTQEQIIMAGQKMTVRKNLAEAIRVIRNPNVIMPVWIDALSINQKDLIERARQVPRMGEIYDFATAVYSYIGNPTEGSESVFSFTKELFKHPIVRKNESNEFHFPSEDVLRGQSDGNENTIKPDQLAKLCAGLYRLFCRQYFRRIWMLQEIAYASNPMVVCIPGRKDSWDYLESAAHKLQDMLSRDKRLSKRMKEADPALKEIEIDTLSYARKLFYFRHLVNGGIGLGFVYVKTSEDAPGFLEAVIMARDFESTDPRDKIFALWNLAQDKTGLDFKPHYTKPYERIYADFARAWIDQNHSLDILGAVEASENSSSFYRKTPSWAPDWSVPTQTSCLVRKDYIPMKFIPIVNDQQGRLYAADGGITHDIFEDPILHFQDNVLHCTGLIIDQVGTILQQPPQISTETVHLQSTDPDWEFHCWTIELTEHFRNSDSNIYEDPLRAAWAMCHGDNTAAWPPNPDFKSPLDDPYTCQTDLSKHISAWVHGYRESEARNIVRQVLRGRQPFISDAGYMGLMPAYIAEKWSEIGQKCHIAVLAGCSVPLILQEKDDETYTVLGACFVQGWMEGEWMETMMGAESPTEFWRGMRGVATLRIV